MRVAAVFTIRTTTQEDILPFYPYKATTTKLATRSHYYHLVNRCTITEEVTLKDNNSMKFTLIFSFCGMGRTFFNDTKTIQIPTFSGFTGASFCTSVRPTC